MIPPGREEQGDFASISSRKLTDSHDPETRNTEEGQRC